MVPDRHGATAWKHWIFCLTDHLDFENNENRRRYQNPGKPRTAGLCGREVVASDHLPLSCTFFGRPKTPYLTHKTSAVVPLPMLFSLWRYHRNTPSSTFAHTGPTRPAASQASPDATPPPKPHTAPHRRQRLPDLLPSFCAWKTLRLPSSGASYLVYSGVDFRPVDKVACWGKAW